VGAERCSTRSRLAKLHRGHVDLDVPQNFRKIAGKIRGEAKPVPDVFDDSLWCINGRREKRDGLARLAVGALGSAEDGAEELHQLTPLVRVAQDSGGRVQVESLTVDRRVL